MLDFNRERWRFSYIICYSS